jgi:hypothetical protein
MDLLDRVVALKSTKKWEFIIFIDSVRSNHWWMAIIFFNNLVVNYSISQRLPFLRYEYEIDNYHYH